MRWLVALALLGCAQTEPRKPVTKEQLGELLFNDTRLSEPSGQACADCHDAKLAFTDPENDRVSAGVIRDRFGVRNAPTAMYASYVPPLHRDPRTQQMIGGLFWDGRADSLEAQALGPLTNPLEMNNPDPAAVVAKIRRYYAREFRDVFGSDALTDEARAFARVGEVIAAFERTPAFAPFSSKYDRYLAGAVALDAAEVRGLAIFEDPGRGNCASCHPSRPTTDGAPPLFTNFSYANLGLPRFADSPYYTLPAALNPEGAGFVDRGLAKTTGDPRDAGLFRVPTLRNIAKTSPYGHNGYMRRLDEMIEMLAGTCLRPGTCTLPAPEVAATAQRLRTGMTLSAQDIADLVAFLRTLDDE